MSGHLILVPTPLGNLGDITYRAIQTLESCDLVACEDTRRTGKLLAHFNIDKPIIRFDDHADTSTINNFIKTLNKNLTIAYCSDAGMPGINDPGFELLRLAREAEANITVLPGPSAVILAIVASGLPSHSFSFWGYLPNRREPRKSFLRNLMAKEETSVVFESNHRINATLLDMTEIMPDREIALGRELTKLHETWYRGVPSEVINQLGVESRGEMVIVIAGADAKRVLNKPTMAHDEEILPKWVFDYVDAAKNGGMTIREIVKPLAKHMGITTSKLYHLIASR